MSEANYKNLMHELANVRDAIMRKELDADVGWDLRDEVLQLHGILAALTQIVYETTESK